MTLNGSCECGAVRYRVADEFRYSMNCHCSRCRRATGSAFKPMGGIEREKLELVEGDGGLLIVDEPSLRPTHHIFVGSKAPWFEIEDDLPQYDEHAQTVVEAS